MADQPTDLAAARVHLGPWWITLDGTTKSYFETMYKQSPGFVLSVVTDGGLTQAPVGTTTLADVLTGGVPSVDDRGQRAALSEALDALGAITYDPPNVEDHAFLATALSKLAAATTDATKMAELVRMADQVRTAPRHESSIPDFYGLRSAAWTAVNQACDQVGYDQESAYTAAAADAVLAAARLIAPT